MTELLPSAGRRRTFHARLLSVVLLAMSALLVGACGGAAVLSTVGSAVDSEGLAPASAAPAEAPAAAGADAGEAVTAWRAANVAGGGPLIVRTGQLSLEVAMLDEALAAAERAVTAAGGYVAASQRQGDGETASATITYRIPAERWDATLAALREVGTKVLSEQTSSDEVTAQVVDLGARLVNLRATEAALQEIMKKATKIPDILEVQAQLTTVRQEIEQLTAQKASLEQQAALATLAVSFAPPPVVAVTQVQEGWDPLAEIDRALATLVGLGQGVASAAIWLAIVALPLLLIVGVVAGIAWFVARRVRPRHVPPVVPPAGPTEAPAA